MIELKQAVILAGGRGERLRPLTNTIPKPMVPIHGIPFLNYLINSVIEVGIKRVLILTGYKSKVIIDRYDNWRKDEIEIRYSVGTEQDQTGRRLLNAYELLDDHFLLLYGDNYWPIELNQMLDLYRRKNAEVLTTVFSNKNGTGEYGYENNISVGVDNFVQRYDKQRKTHNLNGVDIGYFIVNKTTINPDVAENISFEEDILPELIRKKQLIAHIANTQYYYITNMDSLKNFESAVMEKNIQPVPEKYLRICK